MSSHVQESASLEHAMCTVCHSRLNGSATRGDVAGARFRGTIPSPWAGLCASGLMLSPEDVKDAKVAKYKT